MASVRENLSLIRVMSPFWDPHMALPVTQWLKEKQLLEPESCDKLKESILPTTPEGLDAVSERYISSLGLFKENDNNNNEINNEINNDNNNINEETDKMNKVETILLNWKTKSQQLQMILGAYKKHQMKKIGGFPERRRFEEIVEWFVNEGENSGGTEQLTKSFCSDDILIPFYLGRLLFLRGEYHQALQHIDFYLNTVADLTHEGSDLQRPVSCIWGICACILLLQDGHKPVDEGQQKEDQRDDELLQQLQEDDVRDKSIGTVEAHGAARCILKLADILDHSQAAASKFQSNAQTSSVPCVFSREEQLQQRSWLLHWGMWILYRYYFIMVFKYNYTPRNQIWSALLDWVVQERNLTCVHLLCPHLLRYYAVYVIVNRKRRDHFQSIINAISHSRNKYNDRFTMLLEALFIDFNFDKAQQHIATISDACETDFFLNPVLTTVTDQARLLIFETYCRIHKCINVDMIARKVNMSPEAAERWIVNLIRHARLEACIDSDKNRVQRASAPPNLYQIIIEKTRNVCIRSSIVYQHFTRPGYGKDDEVGITRGGRGRGRGGKYKHWSRDVPDGFIRDRRGGGGGGRRDIIGGSGIGNIGRRNDHSGFGV